VATDNDSPKLQTLLWPFKTGLYLGLYLIVLGLIAIGFQVLMAKLTWGVAETTQKIYTRLEKDRAMTFHQGCATSRTNLATKGANAAYWMFFDVTLIDRLMRNAASVGAASIVDKGGDIVVRNNLVYRIQDELLLAMYAAQDYGVRLALLVMAWPLLLLAYALGLVDGLAQRSIRRACAGRESSSLYHLSKHLQFASIAFVGAIYVLQPYAIQPEWFFVPLASLLGLLARLQWMYLKKYL
jgi:integrating conjugative element membrane protein (TIGR03747 family)